MRGQLECGEVVRRDVPGDMVRRGFGRRKTRLWSRAFLRRRPNSSRARSAAGSACSAREGRAAGTGQELEQLVAWD